MKNRFRVTTKSPEIKDHNNNDHYKIYIFSKTLKASWWISSARPKWKPTFFKLIFSWKYQNFSKHQRLYKAFQTLRTFESSKKITIIDVLIVIRQKKYKWLEVSIISDFYNIHISPSRKSNLKENDKNGELENQTKRLKKTSSLLLF